ncbi:Beta galactosidase small chain [Dyadobacter soli]|uniref:beta-galactosidase n=1 Tax=Dyadobacter soli TaxID=659014 RepID=A0A1G7VM08_9BACT|nr:glycoside hydrolase family 2 TIM barrel-domain containing protein [Dyadobacter soli]SDG60449.1 Beta galactosidase small chain [Dyadobacter soli]
MFKIKQLRMLKLCSLLLLGMANAGLAQQSQRVYLSGTDKDQTVLWDFFCSKGQNSGKWTKIAVPSNWEFQGFGKYTYGVENRKDSTKADEVGMYRHSFQVPNDWKSKRVMIVFQGSMTDTDVKINGKSVGNTHQGGFTQFEYEITPFIKKGSNLLEVTVHKESANRSVDVAERHGDFWAFGGIYRPVYLEIKPRQFIDRIAVDAKANGHFSLDVFTTAHAGQQLMAQVQTLNGHNVGEPFLAKINRPDTAVNLKQVFHDVKLWNAETPNLYQVRVSLTDQQGKLLHTLTQRFGFRTVEVVKNDGLYVNGKKVVLRGVNRHTFVPETGRTTSKAVSIKDVQLMQAMNMNAVRMSHYPPDIHFLDVCDSLGMYVLDELTGWQNKYDTIAGRKLLKELVIRDVNHPSILFWDNGNEGGWNRALDGDYALYDPQKRTVLHPWERFNGFDTKHYPDYGYMANSVLYDRDILMPTEFMHGLFDGGHGAGLDDFWDLMLKHPHGAGGFLWVFMDEGVVRTDKQLPGQPKVIDVFGNYAPDGIVGPHYEKEASFYTIKEIWSPVRITRKQLSPNFDGNITVENHYSFTDLSQCKFSWQLVSFPNSADTTAQAIVNHTGQPQPISLPAGQTGNLNLNLPRDWRKSEALYLTATDPNGKELFTWSWTIPTQSENPDHTLSTQMQAETLQPSETAAALALKAGSITYTFDKTTGYLAKVSRPAGDISLTGGPRLAGKQLPLKSFRHFAGSRGYEVEAHYQGDGNSFTAHWLFASGQPAELTYEYSQRGAADFMGVTFDYPQENVTGMKWLGRGPYRVWKNRLRGLKYGVWHKAYNDAVTGENFISPEFKGFHSEVKWVVIETREGNITVYSDEPVFLQMMSPSKPKAAGNDKTSPPFPESTFGFLDNISAIGTKFQDADQMGPQSQKNTMLNGTPVKRILRFDFSKTH